MNIKLNSKVTEVPDNISVKALKEWMKLPEGGVAVAVNGKIVLTPNQASHILADGDDVIIIGAAYGG